MKNLYLKIQNYLRLKLKNNKIQYKIKDLISSIFNIDKENINEDNQSSNWDFLKQKQGAYLKFGGNKLFLMIFQYYLKTSIKSLKVY